MGGMPSRSESTFGTVRYSLLSLYSNVLKYCVLAPALLADVVDFGSFLQTFPNYYVPPKNAAVMSCLTEIHLWLVNS